MPAAPTTVQRPSGRGRAVLHGLVAAGCVVAASLVGSLATTPKIPTWYAGLAKPWYNPPNWVFGPAWTLLFLLMAIAFWRVLQADPDTPGRGRAIAVFVVQLVLNALWSVAFFGLESPLLGIVVIVPFLAAIVVTILAFRPVDRPAAWLLVPYLAWVSFATVLNVSVWWLNR